MKELLILALALSLSLVSPASTASGEKERLRTDPRPRRAALTQALIVPDRLAARILLAVLTRHAPTSQ
jgi:hypothetical protein